MKMLPSEWKRAAFEVGDVTTELSLPRGWCHRPRDRNATWWRMWRGRLGLQISGGVCQGPSSSEGLALGHAGLLTTNNDGCLGPLQFLKADGVQF